MTVNELKAMLPDDGNRPVILWDDLTGQHGDAEYVTNVDGEVTICGNLDRDRRRNP